MEDHRDEQQRDENQLSLLLLNCKCKAHYQKKTAAVLTTNLLLLAAFVFCMIIMGLNYRRKHMKVVFFGDSITSQGIGFKGYIRNLSQYLLDNDLIDKVDLVNAGVPGNTVVDLQNRVASDVLANGADIVVIFIGINDVWRIPDDSGTDLITFEEYYKKLVSRLLQAKINVVLCTLPAIGERKDNMNPLDDYLELYSESIRAIALYHDLPLVDLRLAFRTYLNQNNVYDIEKGLLTHDGVHLNFAGNELVALKMWNVLQPLLNDLL